jgi:hypothetical protein
MPKCEQFFARIVAVKVETFMSHDLALEGGSYHHILASAVSPYFSKRE